MENMIHKILIDNVYTFLALNHKRIPKPLIKIIIDLIPMEIKLCRKILQVYDQRKLEGALTSCEDNMRRKINIYYGTNFNTCFIISELFSEEFILNYFSIYPMYLNSHEKFENVKFPCISHGAQEKFNELYKKNGRAAFKSFLIAKIEISKLNEKYIKTFKF